jgi:hypothetical protein
LIFKKAIVCQDDLGGSELIGGLEAYCCKAGIMSERGRTPHFIYIRVVQEPDVILP